VTPAARRPAGKARAEERVVFRGPPDRLASLLTSFGAAKPGTVREPEATLRGAEVHGLTVRALARAGVDARRATLRLPRSTPPGMYEGSALIEGRKVSIVAEVEPRPRVETDPRRITIESAPGETATVDVTLLNTGNVPCDVSGASTFCLFDGRGMEHAVFAALASDPPEGKQRIDVLLDDLAKSHGGLVTARLEKGSKIAAGESRDVRLTLRFSDRLQPGMSYSGRWEADGLRVPVRVTTQAAKPRRAAKVTG
jgi:hypothetical protein